MQAGRGAKLRLGLAPIAYSPKKKRRRYRRRRFSSGGYCQDTEGFGEMASGAELPAIRPAQKSISVSPLLSRSASPSYQAHTRNPAGAPRRSPEPARRGINRLDVGRPV